MGRPLLLFGTQRAGTTLFYSIIAEYLSQNHSIRKVEEYFNLFHFEVSGPPADISIKSREGFLRLTPEEIDAENDRRVRLLKAGDPARYFMKVLSSQRPIAHQQWLAESYEWIFVERRDRYDQLLSYLISVATGIWHPSAEVRIAPRSLDCNPIWIADFHSLIFEYTAMKIWLSPKHVLFYEDFLLDPDPVRVLSAAGLHGPLDGTRLRLPQKWHTGDKSEYFKDPAKIRQIYEQLQFPQRQE